MDIWKNQPNRLEGENIALLALDKSHFPELQALAADKNIWEFYNFDCSETDIFQREFNKALEEKEKANQFPFVIFHKKENKLIGSTRLLYLQPAHRKLEIGWTWLHPDYWHTAVNAECKSLLLNYCFDTMKAVRVQLKTDEKNIRSRKAIEKTGAQFEGILRNDSIRENGTYRNSAYYSITEEDWNHRNLKRALKKTTDPILKTIPVLRVFDYDTAIDFYVNWLGFKIDWEKKPDDGPFQIQVSLKEIILHLMQFPDKGELGTWLMIAGFKNMVAYRKIISLKSNKYIVPKLRQVPGEPNTLSMVMADPFYNRIEFREKMR